MIGWKTIGNFLSQWYHIKWRKKLLCGNFEKRFLEWEKMTLRKIFRYVLNTNCFVFMLLITNYMDFLVQLGTNFQKAEIALTEAARALLTYWKTHSCKYIPNWTWNHMTLYTNKAISKFVCSKCSYSLQILWPKD